MIIVITKYNYNLKKYLHLDIYLCIMQVFGQLTQLVECHFDVVEVRSSSLLLPTKKYTKKG